MPNLPTGESTDFIASALDPEEETDVLGPLVGTSSAPLPAAPVDFTTDVAPVAPPVVPALTKPDIPTLTESELPPLVGAGNAPALVGTGSSALEPIKDSWWEGQKKGWYAGRMRLAGTPAVLFEGTRAMFREGLNIVPGPRGFPKFLPEGELEPVISRLMRKAAEKKARDVKRRRLAEGVKGSSRFANTIAVMELIQENQPEGVDPLSWTNISSQVTSTIVGNVLPALGVGLIAGPAAGWAVFAAPAFAQQFGDSITTRGRTIEESIADGTVATLAEVVPEGVVVKQVLKGGLPFVKRVFTVAGMESLQEFTTELVMLGYEKGVFGDDISLKEALTRLVLSPTVGFLVGMKMAALTHPMVKRAEKDFLKGQEDLKVLSLSREMDATLVDPGGPFLTRGEKERRSQLQHQLGVLTRLDPTPEIEQAIVMRQVELDDLNERAEVEVEEGGQLTLSGMGLRTVTPPGEPTLLTEPEKAENFVDIGMDANSFVDHREFQNDVHGLRKDRQAQAEERARRVDRFHIETGRAPSEEELAKQMPRAKLTKSQGEAQRAWSEEGDPKGLQMMYKAYKADARYQALQRAVLDKHFPGQETIMLYHGHLPSRPAYTKGELEERLVPDPETGKDVITEPFLFGNAAVNIGIAIDFAMRKVRMEPEFGRVYRTEDMIITQVEVPKDAIGSMNDVYPFETEVIFDATRATHRGFFLPLHPKTGLQPIKLTEEDFYADLDALGLPISPLVTKEGRLDLDFLKGQGQSRPSVTTWMHPTIARQRLPLYHYSPNDELNFPGLGAAIEPPADFWKNPEQIPLFGSPEQFDLTGDRNEHQTETQIALGLPEEVGIDISTGEWTIEPGTVAGSKEGSIWKNDRTGVRYFIKFFEDEQEARNELLGAAFYTEAGLNAPETHFAQDMDSSLGVGAQIRENAAIIESPQEMTPEQEAEHIAMLRAMPGINDAFVIDAWLANWDAVGQDFQNIMIETTPLEERILTIDPGGAVWYRGLMGRKTDVTFDNEAMETETFRGRSTGKVKTSIRLGMVKLYGNMTDEELQGLTWRLAEFTDAKIIDIIERFGPRDVDEQIPLSFKLIARRDAILKRYPPLPVPDSATRRKMPGPEPETLKGLPKAREVAENILKAGLKNEPKTGRQNARGEKQSSASITEKRARLEMDKFNWWVKLTWNILQLGWTNNHIGGLVRYVESQSFMAHARMRWIARAEQRVKEWQMLYKEQADALANLLFDVDEMRYLKRSIKGKIKEPLRQPTDEELAMLVEKHKVGPQALDMYFKIRGDYTAVLGTIEEALIEQAKSDFTDPFILKEKIVEIQADIARLRNRPYFPHSRFGNYVVVVKSMAETNEFKIGEVAHMSTYGTALERNIAFRKLERDFPHPAFNMRKDFLTEDVRLFRGFPPSARDSIIKLMKLDEPKKGPGKERKRKKTLNALEAILFEQADIHSFKKHFEPRKGTPGYSKDAMRNYSDYFHRGANHLARITEGKHLEEAIQQMKEEAELLTAPHKADLDKRRKILRYVEDHMEYVMNPRNDWAQFRSIGFQWFIGFVPASAALNLTQVVLTGLPYLSSVYNDVQATAALGKATKDLRRMYKGELGGRITDEFLKARGLGMQQGFLEESLAMELVAHAGGSVLQRTLPGNKIQRGYRDMQYASAWMFHVSEKLSRHTMFDAAWNLALDHPNEAYNFGLRRVNPRMVKMLEDAGWATEHITAYLAGKDAIERTMYEYASWNRPLLMRGKRSVIFLFYQFIQNTIWFMNMFSNRPGSWRSLAVLLFAAGASGLPWAEDFQTLAKWLARQYDKDWSVEKAFREYVTEVSSVDPDVFLHGASRDSFGLGALGEMLGWPMPRLDMSGRLSMGQIAPGMPYFEGGDFQSRFQRGATDAGGAVTSGMVGILQALSDSQNPDNWKRWERAMPSELKNISKSVRRLYRGKETSRSGATIAEFDPNNPMHVLESAFQAGGWAPTRLSKEYDRRRMVAESVVFWRSQKTLLMAKLDDKLLNKDREGIADLKAAIRKYNRGVPFDSLRITGEDFQRSREQRAKTRAMEEAGLPTAGRRFAPLGKSINRLFPETNEEEVTVEEIH